jgi:hypothetical protein
VYPILAKARNCSAQGELVPVQTAKPVLGLQIDLDICSGRG